MISQLLLAVASCSVAAAAFAADAPAKPVVAAAAAEVDRPVVVKIRSETAQAMYRTQCLAEPDHPIGDHIELNGTTLRARADAKGNLELDLKGDGKFRTFAQSTSEAVAVSIDGGKKTFAIQLYLNRGATGWTYRNATQLTMLIGQELLTVIDVNGNGIYNEPGIDGLAWAGSDYLFPLPGADERWCSTSLDLTGLSFGPLGEDPKVAGRLLATTKSEALAVLQGVNHERAKLGLCPRPEDAKLSADLQAHCAYMAANSILSHPEDSTKPGYSAAGNAAGMRSILSMGVSGERVAAMMVQTYFHRQDVLRPETLAFGVGSEGAYDGIDGRSNMAKAHIGRWPVLCPAPDERDIPLTYAKEMPDATPGDASAGYPITAYFAGRDLVLKSATLKAISGKDAGQVIDCYLFDPKTGASPDMTGYQRCVAVIAKDPLQGATTYEVELTVQVGATEWNKTWQFTTVGAAKPRKGN